MAIAPWRWTKDFHKSHLNRRTKTVWKNNGGRLYHLADIFYWIFESNNRGNLGCSLGSFYLFLNHRVLSCQQKYQRRCCILINCNISNFSVCNEIHNLLKFLFLERKISLNTENCSWVLSWIFGNSMIIISIKPQQFYFHVIVTNIYFC